MSSTSVNNGVLPSRAYSRSQKYSSYNPWNIFTPTRLIKTRRVYGYVPTKTGEYISKSFFYEKHWRVINTIASIWIQKYAGIFVRRNLKTQQSQRSLCVWEKNRSGKSKDYRDVIVSKSSVIKMWVRPHENEKSAFTNSFSLKAFSKSSAFVTD